MAFVGPVVAAGESSLMAAGGRVTAKTLKIGHERADSGGLQTARYGRVEFLDALRGLATRSACLAKSRPTVGRDENVVLDRD
jgi:hypothetical protein